MARAATTNVERHSWLTNEFLEKILKSSENQTIVKVINYQLHDAVAKGENYTSYLMRITVNYTDNDELNVKRQTFVVKTTGECEVVSAKFISVGVFDKEIAFYRDIQPKFKKYTDMIDKSFKCAARSFATNTNPPFLVFEDLTALNYHIMDRKIGLDFNAAAMLLRKLAKMHAINAMIYEDSPELFEPHKIRTLSREKPEFLATYMCGTRDCQQMCLKWPGYEHFYDKLQRWLDNALEIWELTYNKDESTFNTLIHGDLWVANIMYQFDDKNTPVDVLMVDFQIGYYGPPALDLTYLFYTSTVNGLFEKDWDRLLQIYHAELVRSLELVDYPKRIPTLTELQIQMYKKSLCAAIVSLTIIPPRHLDTKDADIEVMLTDSDGALNSRYALYDRPIVYERIKYLLDYYDRKGFFDALP